MSFSPSFPAWLRRVSAAALALLGGLAGSAGVVAAGHPADTVVYATYADMKDWDPAVAFSTEVLLLTNVYETLLRHNPPGSPQAFTPVLATDWQVSADGLAWTFHLRQGVRFHDGERLDAAAVKASLERTIQMGKGAAYIWDAVSNISAPDPRTVVIRTKVPAPIDLIAASQYGAYIISPKSAAKGSAWFAEGHDGGSGPYAVRLWAPGQRVVLERFEGHWRGSEPGQIKRVLLDVVLEAATQTQLLRSGEADFITLPSADMVKVLATEPGIVVERAPSWVNTQFLINTQRYPTDNLAFRQALTWAWDYRAVAEKIYEGGARPARGIIPATLWGHDAGLEAPGFDLARARALLQASGVPPKDWRITAAYIGTSEEFKNALVLFRARLAQLGVTLVLRPGPWGKIWNEAKDLRSAPHLQSMTWWPTYVSPGDALGGLFRTEKPTLFNLSHYANAEFDRLLAEGLALEATDRAAATRRFQAAQRLLIRDAVAIFVADLDGRVIYRKGLRGVRQNPAYSTVFFDDLRRP